MKVNKTIRAAKNILMEYWPLDSFIATNPLWSLREKHFFDVVSHPNFNGLMNVDYYRSHYKAQRISHQSLRNAIKEIEHKSLNDAELKQWVFESDKKKSTSSFGVLLSEQLDEYHFQNPVTWIKEQLFILLRNYFGLANYQHTNLIRFWHSQSNIRNAALKNMKSTSVERSIMLIMTELNIPEVVISDYLQAIYLHIYGWSSFMNWRNRHPNNDWIPGEDPCEIILLMWLSYEYMIANDKKIAYNICLNLPKASQKESFKERYIWQTAFEQTYFNELYNLLNKDFNKKDDLYEAQFIFCIDTRSEGLRRHIEAQGNYQTFGYAGFFGAIFKVNNRGDTSYQAPALVQPTATLNVESQDNKLNIFVRNIRKIIRYSKKQLASSFALFEMLGFLFVFFMIFKTFRPKLKIRYKSNNLIIKNTLSETEQFQAAYNLLTSIGLVNNFSSWVLVCAHQTDNTNNPFKSSLNCGACGGNSGIPNSIIICDILNNQNIRAKLKKVGISIPYQSQFIPACHHTSYDRLEILKGRVKEDIIQAVTRAANKLRAEKSKVLPGGNKLSYREQSWSELIPELGLINNTAIIIGPRELTLNQNLGRRVFLHSYEPSLDKDGDILTSLLTAPAIVSHWISSQYYFSTVNPELFGAGNKAIHNVLPNVGVLEGNLSDLKIGLPMQSTHFQSSPIHEPRRIITIVYANKITLDLAIKNSPVFKTLLDNKWIYLKHIEAKQYTA